MAEAYLAPLEPLDDTSDEPRGLSLRDLVVALQRRWWVVMLLAGAILAGGIVHTWRQPRLYQATTTVRLQAAQAPINGVPTVSPRLDYRIDPLQSEQVVIKSQQVAERAARALGLQVSIDQPQGVHWSDVFGDSHPRVDDALTSGSFRLRLDPTTYALSKDGGAFVTAPYGDSISVGGLTLDLKAHPKTDKRELTLSILSLADAAGIVQGGIDTHVLPSTDLIEISYTGGDPAQVRDITNAIALTYQAFSTEGSRESAAQKTQFIDQSLREQERALASAQDALKNFKESNQTADASDEAKALFKSITDFETERQQLLTEQKVYETLMGKVAAADTVDDQLRRLAGTGILKNEAILAKFEQWQDLATARQKLMVTTGVTAHNPDVQRYDAAISDAKKSLGLATQLYLQGVQTRLESLDQTIAQMKAQSEKYPPLEAEQAKLDANVQTAEKMYVDLQSQLQLARIAQSADGGTVRIIDVATMPLFAVSPNRKRAFLMYLLLGLVAGVGSAVGLERLDDSVRSPLELGENYRLPVLGLIPGIRASELPDIGNAPGLNRIVTHADPRSPVAEAYRSLRTNLAFARSDRGLRTVVLTSPGPADGKSTTVANLAITFAQQGQRTLLVDADLRRAVLDKTFGISRNPGLTDVIIGEKRLEEAVVATQVPNLSVLPSGQLPPNPSELLGSPAMRHVIEAAREQFDIVLFDSPPLLAVTDAAVLSTMVDGAILIARMGSTQRKALWRAVTQLRTVRANMLGGVLNDVSAQVGAYYGGYGYYYYYAYQAEGTAQNGQQLAGVLGRLKRLTGARLSSRN